MMGPSKWERHTGSKKKKWKESIKLKNSKRTLLSWVKFCFLLKDVNVFFIVLLSHVITCPGLLFSNSVNSWISSIVVSTLVKHNGIVKAISCNQDHMSI